MASDRTHTKRAAFVAEAGSPDALLPCPTCKRHMAVDRLHMMAAVDKGRLPSNREARYAEASHTVPASAGGRLVALECNRCNRKRGDAGWSTDQPTYAEGKRAAYREANGWVLASRERLQAEGYDDD